MILLNVLYMYTDALSLFFFVHVKLDFFIYFFLFIYLYHPFLSRMANVQKIRSGLSGSNILYKFI